ncbi:uncharacterized protein M6B38_380710 [Iris pallida]|uniref:Uncharacterized protein n=1 Tax=Iris pallida TaxID=29817 RepID=A0AAX6GAC7_IRIPA|nr:uncharacterized protein M6B38_380710 [Iris pallida]
MDPGLHRHQLRLLRLLLPAQVRHGHLPGPAQLPRHRLRSRQGLRLVLRPRPPLPPPPPRPLPRSRRRLPLLRPPVAPDHLNHLPPLSPSVLPVLAGRLQHLLVQHGLLRPLHPELPGEPVACARSHHQLQRRQRRHLLPRRQRALGVGRPRLPLLLPPPQRGPPPPRLLCRAPPHPPSAPVLHHRPPARRRSPRLPRLPPPQRHRLLHRPLPPPPQPLSIRRRLRRRRAPRGPCPIRRRHRPPRPPPLHPRPSLRARVGAPQHLLQLPLRRAGQSRRQRRALQVLDQRRREQRLGRREGPAGANTIFLVVLLLPRESRDRRSRERRAVGPRGGARAEEAGRADRLLAVLRGLLLRRHGGPGVQQQPGADSPVLGQAEPDHHAPHRLLLLLLLRPPRLRRPRLLTRKAPLRKDGVANDRAGTNAPGFLLAGGVQRRACTNSRHRAGGPELGVHLRRSRVGHGGAVRAQQRGPQPQHPHHQHPPRLPPLRPTRRPGLRRQRHLRIRGGVSALRRQDGVHGEGVLRADLPVVGGHLARRARLQRRAVLEDEEGVQPRRAEPTDGAYTRRKLHQRKLQRSVRVAIAQLGVIENDRDIDRIERIIVSRRKGACKNQSVDDLQKS